MYYQLTKITKLILIFISLLHSGIVFSQVNAGADKSVCTNSSSISAIPTGGVWSTSGNATITSPSTQSTTITNLDPGPNTFTYTVSGLGSDQVIITNNTVTADAGADVNNLCSGTSSLNGSIIPAGGTGEWSLLFSTPGVIIDNTASSSTDVSNLPFGTTTLVWTVSANDCNDTDEINITNNLAENNNGTDQSGCTNTFYMGAENPPSGGSGNWTVVTSPGTVVFNNTAIPSVQITAPIGASTVRWTITYNGCPSSKDFVISNNLPAPDAGSNISTCIDEVNLNATALLSGEQGVWSVISPQGEIFSNASIHNPTVSNVKQGTTTFEWKITNAYCTATDQVQVINNRPDVSAGVDDEICTNSYTLNANNPSPNTGSWSSSISSVSFSNINLYNATVSNLINNNYIFTWTVSNGICNASDQIVLISNYIAISAGNDQSLCSSSFSLSGTAIPSGGSGYWTRTFGDGTVDNSLSANTTALNISEISHFKWTIVSGSCTYEDETELVNQLPNQANTQIDKDVCTNQTLITANPPVDQNEAGIWSIEGIGNANIQSPTLFQTLVTNLDSGPNTFRWTIYNQNCSTYDLITVTNNQISTDAGSDQTICSGFATLNAVNSGGTGYWTSSNPTVTFTNSTSPTSSVSNLGFGTNTLSWTRNDLGCTATDQVVITNNLPQNVFAGYDQTVCEDNATLTADNPSYGNGTWTIISGTGTFDNNTLYQTDVNNLSLGSNIFRWTVNYQSCSSYDEVEISDKRIVVSAGADFEICNQLSTNLSADPPGSGQNGTWSIIGGGGTFSNISLYNTSVSNLVKGINTYKWTVSDIWCSNSDEVTVLNNTPDSAKVSANQIICTNSTSINAVSVTNGIGSWSVSSGSGIFQNSLSNNTQVSSVDTGANIFTWTVTKNNCSLSANLTVNNSSVNAQIPDDELVICESSHSTTLTAVNPTEPGAGGLWTKISSGSGNIVSPSNYQTTLTNLSNGDLLFRWTVSNSYCSSFDEIIVTNNYYTASASPVGSASVCSDYIGILGNSIPPSGTGNWTANSPLVTFDNAAASNTFARNLPVGPTNLTWTISKDGCNASTDFNVYNNSLTVSAGNDIIGCESSQTLDADDLASGQSGYWTANNASVVFANSADPNTIVSNIPMGTSQLTWTITANSCYASDDMILINNSFYVDAGSNKTICGTNSSIIGTDPLANGTGIWTVIEGSATISNPSSYLTNVSNLSNGNNVFRWTVNRNSCQATDEVTIINDLYVAQATAPSATCIDEVLVSAQALPAGSGASGIWTTLLGGGIFDNPNNAITTARGLSLGSNRFRWTVTKGSCSSIINVDVINNRIVVDAGNDQITCDNYSSVFATPLTSTGTGLWTCDIGTVGIQTPATPFSNVTNLRRGANTFTWTVSDKGCTGNDVMVITNNSFDADAGSNQEIIISTAIMNALLPTGATGKWTIVNGEGTFSDDLDPITNVTNLGYGINNFRWTVNLNNCYASDDVEIIYNVAEAYAGTNQISCNDYALLNADQPLMGSGVWSIVQGSGTFQNPADYNTMVSNVGRGTNTYRWTVTAYGISESDDVNITNNTFDIYAGVDQQTCNTIVQMDAEYNAGDAGFWYIFAGSGDFSNNYDNKSTVTNMRVGTNLYIWQVQRNGCTATDTVKIFHYQPVTDANAGNDAVICDENNFLLSANIPDYGTGNWSSENSSVTFDNPALFNTTVRNLPNGSTSLWWTITNQNCQSEDDIIISSYTTVEIINQPNSQEMDQGSSVSFTVETYGNVESYQWQKDGVNLSNGGRISGANSATLNITELTMDDVGQYQCIINGYCNYLTSDIVSLSVVSGFEDLNENGIKIFPNPSKGIIHLDIENKFNLKGLFISKLNGEIILNKKSINNKETMDLSYLADGVYIIYLDFGKELIKSKLIIQK